MKKTVYLLFMLCLICSLAACKKGTDDKATTGSSANSTSEQGTTAPSTTEAKAATTAAVTTEAPGTTEVPATTEAPVATEVPANEGKITLEYPANMQEKGFTEPIVLDKVPTRAVSMSTAPVLALNRLGIKFVAVPKSSVVTWPENMGDVQLLETMMNSNFDIETVVVLEPDLVFLSATAKETYGTQLESAGIPVYYLDAGHTVSYESVKSQTEIFVKAFGKGTAEGDALMKEFVDLEAKLEETKKKLEGKTVMILQSSPPSHYIQTEGGTLGTMAKMIGLTNVYTNDAAALAPVDLEQALTYDPDLVLTSGMMPTSEGHKKLMEEDFAKNPEYWNSIKAIKNGDIIYLPVSFTSTAGINIIDRINELNELVLKHFEAK